MRRFAAFLIVVVVIVLLLVGIDRGADYYAEDTASTALTSALGGSTDTTIDGFPFLTQWGSGEFQKATLTADHIVVNGTKVNDMRVTLWDVRAPQYASTDEDVLNSTAGSVTMVGTVPYGSLPMPAGIKAKREGETGNLVRLNGNTSVLGRKVRFVAVATVSVHEGNVRLRPKKVRFLGTIPSAAITALVRNSLRIDIKPPGLPPKMTLSGVSVVDTGLRTTAIGRDVQLPRQ